MHICGVIPASVWYISAQCWIVDTEAYRHKLVSFSIPQPPHYIKKGPGVCRGARPCAPLRFSHIPMWSYPLRDSAVHVAYTARSPQSILCNNISCGNIQSSVWHISAQCWIVDTEAYRHKLVSFSIPQSPHYIKKAQGCAEGRGLVPLCGFLTFQCDLPSAGFRRPCGTYGQISAIYAVIRPEFRNLRDTYGQISAIYAAHTAGASAAYAVIIFPYRI